MKIELLNTKKLDDFPSGSSMEFYNNVLYLVGDDASKLLMLDKNYTVIDTVTLFDSKEYRIAKKKKTDLEASAVIAYKQRNYLLLLGSASKEKREKVLLLALDENDNHDFEIIKTELFVKKLLASGVEKVNIEGAAAVGDKLILSNRGNKNHPDNLLIRTSTNFFEHQDEGVLSTSLLDINKDNTATAGISGLCYSPFNDTLFFTASTELTDNAFDYGEIGDSFLGMVYHISEKLNQKIIEPDSMINLSKTNAVFKGEKIESICIEQHDHKGIVFHLVSDNDDGKTGLYKIALTGLLDK